MAKLMSVSFSPCLTAPFEKTVKLTTGAPRTTTAGTALACSTENAEVEFEDVSLAGTAAAAAIACASGVPPGGGAGGAGASSPPQPVTNTQARAAARHHFLEHVIRHSSISGPKKRP